MPCRDGQPTPGEQAQKRIDGLVYENDQLRELVILSVTRRLPLHVQGVTPEHPANSDVIPVGIPFYRELTRNQIEHRKIDLKRCREELERAIQLGITDQPMPDWASRKSIDQLYAMLGRVSFASPHQALEPQLGFDPDSI